MASIVWKSIFTFLAAELVVTLLLVVPIPLKIRAGLARITRMFPTDRFAGFVGRLRNPLLFIGIGLGLALVESLYTHQRILARIDEDRRGVRSPSSYVDYFYPGLHDKERRYKSERNIYLSGFALTLLFVIGRIAALLRESIELHGSVQRLENALSSSSSSKDRKKAN
mmetsp:Transcript_21959/g.52269  ORF Transcript_21959/g.52269 Transcript_21959/m.52269 type:complete len:168 (+) Transcript_21959:145-648(+)